ncbi:MAG: hypothetical protein QOE79_204 [Sphingomonadales bacterium]|nr:hypothetical protein [Sphingomonadales bacterium]MEA3050223.1 hypothetical protein [Sphingomonadales bacterium]
MAGRLATALKTLLLVALSPLILVAAIVAALFGGTQAGSAEEVADYLRDFLDGEPGVRDWDDFTSVPCRDPGLDGIRKRAAAVPLPLDEEGAAVLRGLLADAEALAREEKAAHERNDAP